MSKSVQIKQVDAFTSLPFQGNPAGVVLDAEGLSDKLMQNIAREMNLSETVFVLPPTEPEADIRLRWFTPSKEVDLCGHATIAAFHALAEEGRYGLEIDEPQSFIVETRSGNLVVDVEWRHLMPYIRFSLPIPRFFPFPGELATLCGALGISEIELNPKARPLIAQNGYCFVLLSSKESLKSAEPDQLLLRKLDELYNLNGFILATLDTDEPETQWQMRFFAPSLGVFEDPVTGSANGPMAAFLWENGMVDETKSAHQFRAAQGKHVKRPGFVDVLMVIEQDELKELSIAGTAVTVMEGTFTV